MESRPDEDPVDAPRGLDGAGGWEVGDDSGD